MQRLKFLRMNIKFKTIWILFFLILIVKQLAWIAFIPLWQFPDEQAHFAQVQNLVEASSKTGEERATTSREIYESEVILGTDRNDLGNNNYTYHPEFNIEYTDTTEGKFESVIKSFPNEYRSDRVIREATGYPPLYYQLDSLLYRLVYNSDLINRVFFARLINIFLFGFFTIVIYRIGLELFNSKYFSLLFTVMVTFHPMLSYISCGVNSDNLFNLLFAVGILLSLRLLNRGWQVSTVLLMFIILFLIMKTKPHGVLLALLYLFPVCYLLIKGRRAWIKYVLVFSVLLFFAFGSPLRSLIQGEQFLPEIGPLQDMPPLSFDGFFAHLRQKIVLSYRLILPWYWGVFRWLSLTYPRAVHRIINLVILFGGIGLLLAIHNVICFRAKSMLKSKLFFFLIYASAIYFFILTSYDYLFTQTYGFSFGFQGRYFFPVISAHMALLLIGIKTLFSTFKISMKFLKCLGLAMIGLHFYAHYFVSASYYAAVTLGQSFRFASQYKPLFFKSPYLEIISILLLILYGLFSYKFLQVRYDKEN
ncbi:MAG: hypothetical protein UV59_C0001G0021 [Candidatus Gottesmanbacteria bacterium GW2011_GWA1_43_11]|uniref:Glycosyltransferase RgtA/B/C/D-like domain-containing protein n=1 Tax=Candidatus Gottesmanbacteria bacterium GW2011_GWA1_43_11 TaxID=1618436 RepID=A0A0G1FHI2_9BACT|nr:MAG: hypothetical protein UV59_C0001G0021 [Candidatus Gottesmanbacteria bacterium GW2011_GWA1_43_11]